METENSDARYNVFTRTWWKANRSWPDGREPQAGRKTYKARNVTYSEARDFCANWNATHNPGKFSRKAEFEAR